MNQLKNQWKCIGTLNELCEQLENSKYILGFAHSNVSLEAAGVEKYILNEVEFLKKINVKMLNIFPLRNSDGFFDRNILKNYYGIIYEGKFYGAYTKEDIIALTLILEKANSSLLEIQIHHLKNYQLDDLMWMFKQIHSKIRFFVHDFFTLCYTGIMLKNGKEFCGAGRIEERKCKGCECWKNNQIHFGKMMNFISTLKERLIMVFPSQSTADIWKQAYGELVKDYIILPHLKLKEEKIEKINKSHKQIRIAFVGAPIFHKGWDDYVDITERIDVYEYYHFGAQPNTIGNWKQIPVSYLKDGENAMTNALLNNQIDIVLMLTKCAETYGYTLYESALADCMLISLENRGNVSDTIMKNKWGYVFKTHMDLLRYLQNEERVVSDLKEFYENKIRLTCEVNEELVNLINIKKKVDINNLSLTIHNHHIQNITYCLKMMKRKLKKRKY